MTRWPLPSRNDVVPSSIMSSISPVPKTPWPVSKVQNWLLLLVGVNGPAGPLNSSLHTNTQFVCAPADDASNRIAAPSRKKYRHAEDMDFPIRGQQSAPRCFDSGLPRFQVTGGFIIMAGSLFEDLRLRFAILRTALRLS